MHLRLALTIAILFPLSAGAWGRRGHSSIAEIAGYIASHYANTPMTKEKSYDLGYYSNVPDLIWKSTHHSDEHPHHMLNLESFDRMFQKREGRTSDEFFIKDHAEFLRKYPETDPKAGRAVWRIQELYEKLRDVSAQLRKNASSDPEHLELQGQWLLLAGTLGHYAADMGMPLHCSENYDGIQTGQPGLHKFFEEVLVDELFPVLAPQVMSEAMVAFPKFHKENAQKDVFRMSLELCRNSLITAPQVLRLDKQLGRQNIKRAKRVFQKLIKERFVKSVLLLTEIWQRELDWKYESNRFFNFYGEPEWIVTGATSTPKEKTGR